MLRWQPVNPSSQTQIEGDKKWTAIRAESPGHKNKVLSRSAMALMAQRGCWPCSSSTDQCCVLRLLRMSRVWTSNAPAWIGPA